jgi:hypothetical protein
MTQGTVRAGFPPASTLTAASRRLPRRRNGRDRYSSRHRVFKAGAGLAIGLVGVMLTAAPSSAADRQGNQGRGTGWVLRGIPSSPNTDVWFGTHLFARAGGSNIDALCLDFARLGPRTAPAIEGDYQTFASTTGNPTADRQLTYLTAVVGSHVTADGLENDETARNLAAAATVATWGIGEFVGFEEGPSGIWANAWLSGDASFLRASPNDAGADTAAIAELFQLLRVGGGSLQFGSAVATVSGGGSLAPGTTTSSLTINVSVPGGGPVPLLPIRVDSISNISGVSLGQVFRTDANGNVGPIPVSLVDPLRGGGAGFSLGLATGNPSLWQSTRIPGRQRLVTTLVPDVVSTGGGLRVQKLSEQSLPIKGTRFEVRTTTGEVAGRLEIGDDGFSQTLPLPSGEYTIVETSVTPGHTVHVPVRANIVSDVLATVPIKNLTITELKVTSQVTSRNVAPGATASDTITVAGLIGIERATVELELYDLTVNPPGGPLGTPLATYRVEGMVNGESRTFGNYTVPVALAGHVLGYRERITATSEGTSGADRTGDWTALGIPEETFQVTDVPGGPAISTDVSFGDPLRIDSKRTSSAVPIGEPVTDTVFVHGLATDETATVEVELYDRTTSPPVFITRSSRTGVGNGRTDDFTSYTPTVDAAGRSFIFRHRIVSTTQGRSTDWSSFDVNEEAFVVNDLQLTSRVSASVVAVGGTVSDTVFLHGLAPNETASVALEIFDLTTDPLGTGQPLYRLSRGGIGNGTTTGLAPYTVPKSVDGHAVGYRHRIETTTSGRSTPWSWLGDNTESFGVGRLNVGSFVSAASTSAGTSATDAVFIEGLAPGETATAKLELFDLTVDPKGDRSPLSAWSAPDLVNGNNILLASFTAGTDLRRHRLGYRHMITTSTGRSTPWSALGEPSETFFAGGDPCVAGSVQVPVVGQVIFDNVNVAQLTVGELATVELELYDLTADPTGQSPLAKFSIPGVGNGTFTGGNYLVTTAHAGHRLGYRERIVTTTLGRSTPFSALGAPNETVSVCGQ